MIVLALLPVAAYAIKSASQADRTRIERALNLSKQYDLKQSKAFISLGLEKTKVPSAQNASKIARLENDVEEFGKMRALNYQRAIRLTIRAYDIRI